MSSPCSFKVRVADSAGCSSRRGCCRCPLNTSPCARSRGQSPRDAGAVAAQVAVPPVVLGIHAQLADALFEQLDALLALPAADDLADAEHRARVELFAPPPPACGRCRSHCCRPRGRRRRKCRRFAAVLRGMCRYPAAGRSRSRTACRCCPRRRTASSGD